MAMLANLRIANNDLKDEIGNKYGRLTVISYAGLTGRRLACWECLCECGNKIITRGSNLRSGHTKSCGCQRVDSATGRKSEYGESSFKNLYANVYKTTAKRRNIDFDITIEEFKKIVLSNCVYCGSEPSNYHLRTRGFGSFRYNGIDRVDNSRGYIKGNVVPCCKRCNYMKHSMDRNDFLSHVEKIAKHIRSGFPTQSDKLKG